jgi:single-strand DNA-binding protein
MSYIVTEGNVVADAALRETHGGKAVANAVIRVDMRVRNEDGSYSDGPTSDYEITVFGKPAEYFAASATRGARVFAAGELSVERYNDQDGAIHLRRRIVADHHGVSTHFAPAASRRRNGDQ